MMQAQLWRKGRGGSSVDRGVRAEYKVGTGWWAGRGHLRDGDAGVMTSKWSSWCAGGRPARDDVGRRMTSCRRTRVCLKRKARHEIASVELLTRMSTCVPRHAHVIGRGAGAGA